MSLIVGSNQSRPMNISKDRTGVFVMAGIGPIVVASIAEAINKASDFPDAIAWMVAPLATRSGGKRSWQVFRVRSDEDHDEIVGWCKENDPGAKLPTLDVDLSELPELPPSKVQLWELVYIDGNSDLLGPRIWIDPTATSQPKTAQPTPQAAPAAPQQEKTRQPDPTPPLGAEVILRAFEAQISAGQAAQAQSLALLRHPPLTSAISVGGGLILGKFAWGIWV